MRRILFILLFLLITINSYALNLSRVKTWNANDILTASDLNAEFNNITNHSILNADIGASAGIVASKLDQAVAGAIGATTPNTGAFTTLSATGNVTLDTNTLFLDSSANNIGIGTTAPLGILQVGTSPTPGLIVTSAGNVGIGLTTPTKKLHISGNIQANTGTFDSLVVTSTVKVTNLNADLLDGSSASTTTGSAVIPIADASGYLPDNSVDTTALKTTTVELSSVGNGNITVTGAGSYAFWPQVKTSAGSGVDMTCDVAGSINSTTYITNVRHQQAGGTAYSQFRYVTASGQDYWLFLLVDKATKEIISASGAPDHPAYGNGGDFNKIAHPFNNYDLNMQEIILVDNSTITELKSQATEDRTILTQVNEDYKVDFSKEEAYQPLHSGKFLGSKPELVPSIPSYIKVRKLIKLNDTEKQEKKTREAQRIAKAKQDKSVKENKIKQKLSLTDSEFSELKEILR